MPNRYEREIEEILRKAEESHPNSSDRIRAFRQRPPLRPQRSLQLKWSTEVGLVTGISLAFIAATIKWVATSSIIAPTLGIISFFIIVVTLVLAWIRPSVPQTSWRGRTLTDRGGTRRNPFSSLLIRINLIKLRMNYRHRSR
jgi:hypothetical protein